MPEFTPGLLLCRSYCEEAVRPILDEAFPGLRCSAARIGSGSDILGLDTEMSTDHDWGPSLQLFLTEDDARQYGEQIRETLAKRLPREFGGYPTSYKLNEDRTHSAEITLEGPVRHRVDVITIPQFFTSYLGFDIQMPIEPADWLCFPEQKLLGISAGEVYYDGIGLNAIRDRFSYYPHDVWIYLLAAGWNRIGQEEHLMGRAGSVGDELGSALIASRLVRDIMRLGFLMERTYAPYAKWFGSAFRALSCAVQLEPLLIQVTQSTTWQQREAALVTAYGELARMQNSMKLTELRTTTVAPFYDRPFQVIHLHSEFAFALAEMISDPIVKRIASRRLLGSIDQVSDNTDLLTDPEWRRVVRRLYE